MTFVTINAFDINFTKHGIGLRYGLFAYQAGKADEEHHELVIAFHYSTAATTMLRGKLSGLFASQIEIAFIVTRQKGKVN